MSKFINYINRLEELRITGERSSQEVNDIAHFLFDGNTYASKLGDEVWMIYEQAIIASLDVGDIKFAKECLLKVGERFPDSHRFKRLCGMSLEAENRMSDALDIYNQVLAEHETNLPILKRKIAIDKALGYFEEAIKGLLKYLDVNPTDKEAWLELSNVYMSENMLERAAHCLEELILLENNNHIYHLKYAEILYSLGHISLALKSFCRVVELSKGHIRGFFGVHMCATKMLNSNEPADTKMLKDLLAIATQQLLAAYSKKKSQDKKSLEAFLNRNHN